MNKITKEECEKFLKDPTTNPKTGKRMMKNKGPYLRYKQLCEQKEESKMDSKPISNKLTTKDCDEFKANPTKHPITKKRLIPGKKPYNNVVQECETLQTIHGILDSMNPTMLNVLRNQLIYCFTH